MKSPVPKAVAHRLSLYLRRLEYLAAEGVQTVASRALATPLGLKDAQVRKDLAYFGTFGRPGIGYPVADLMQRLRAILGTDHAWRVALVGCGNVGRALLAHERFAQRGFHIVAAFDAAPDKIGRRIGHVVIEDAASLVQRIRSEQIPMAILAIPARAAQAVALQLADAGVRGILNFAPATLNLPDGVVVSNLDLTTWLEQISFHLSNPGRAPA